MPPGKERGRLAAAPLIALVFWLWQRDAVREDVLVVDDAVSAHGLITRVRPHRMRGAVRGDRQPAVVAVEAGLHAVGRLEARRENGGREGHRCPRREDVVR